MKLTCIICVLCIISTIYAVYGCETSEFGCCADDRTPAQGPNSQGCLKAPRCGLPRDRGPCRNFSAKWYFDTDYGGCWKFWYSGCDGNENRFNTEDECKAVCVDARQEERTDYGCGSSQFGCCPDGQTPARGPNSQGCVRQVSSDPTAVCSLPSETGTCRDFAVKWFFNSDLKNCARFWYGGCDGNGNRFETKEACETLCVKRDESDVCGLPKDEGQYKEGYQATSWYYDSDRRQCDEFVYAGEGGNENRFDSKDDCDQRCANATSSTDVCQLPKEKGRCSGFIRTWYYDAERKRCDMFVYGGCEGNGNRFNTRDECRQRCG